MTPLKQLNRHDPANGVYGDCFRTCVASLLDLAADEVPHVFDNNADGDAGHAAMEAWLGARGMRLVWVRFDASATLQMVLDELEANNPGLSVMLGVQSRPGVGHFVVAKGGRVACDPALTPAADLQPHMDGVWYAAFIGKLV